MTTVIPTAADLFPASDCRDGHYVGPDVAAAIRAKQADPLAALRALPELPEPGALEAALREFAELLGPDTLRRAAHRGAAIEELRERKVTGAAMVVGAALGIAPAAEPGTGGALVLPTPEPWPVPVDGAQTLSDLATVVRRHVILTAEQADVVALWVAFSHAIDGARIAPKLGVTSPTPRCGKSTMLGLVAELVPRPLVASNISPAAVYRVIEAVHPTLLIDEADSFMRDNEELRGVLNSGHSRAGAFVVRCTGDDLEPRRFPTWCAQAIGLIGSLPPTLADRSIEIRLQRKRSGETVPKLTRLLRERLSLLARQVARWVADHPIADSSPAMPAGLNDRAADNWEPLLAIADLAGGEWPERARRAALTLSGGEPEDAEAVGVRLLGDIRTIFEARQADRLPSADIVAALVAMEDRPWPEWRGGKPITPRQLAQQLHNFAIDPRNLKLAADVKKGYLAEDFGDAWARYCPQKTSSPPENPVSIRYRATDRINTGQSGDFASATKASGSGSKNAVSPNKDAGGSAVADGNPESGGEGEKPAAQRPLWQGEAL